jgi:hypothetical protein
MQFDVLEGRQLLATITVNTTADGTNSDSTLSLRQAIEISNGTLAVSSLSTQQQAQVSGKVGGSNTIDFNIPTTDPGYDAATGVWTIAPQLNPLPAISTNAAIIDGYSQPGSSRNTLAHGDNAKLKIALNGGLQGIDGLTFSEQGSQVFGLDFEKFQDGVVIAAPGNVQVAGCFIGTDPTGETRAGNSDGVLVENSSNLIGGPIVGDRNIISGNYLSGIYVPNQTYNVLNITPTGNLIENNFIGLDATGTKALSNASGGVQDNGTGDTYGGTTAGLGNVVSGNVEGGISALGSVTIEGNYVGTDAAGNVALGNGGSAGSGVGIAAGDYFRAESVTTIISNNVVSGNDEGIDLNMFPGSQTAYTIANNLIGTNAAGTSALGNTGIGLSVSVDNATVENNVISANYEGVVVGTVYPLSEVHLQHDVFLGNLIGTDKTGTIALGNKTTGIEIDTSAITIGGTGPGQANVVAHNGYGIIMMHGQQDQFTRNSIFGNTGFPGSPPPGLVVDPPLNQSIAAPVLTFTPGTGGNNTLAGTLTEAPNTTYVVEVFSNPSARTADQAQGQTFLQDVNVKTDGTGKGTFSLTEPTSFYTATATDPSGDTSQFSNAAGLVTVNMPATTTTVSSSQNPSTLGHQVTFTAVVTAAGFRGTPTGTVTFTIDGKAQTPVSLSLVGGKDEARFVTSTLTAGQHTVAAAYSGDTNVSGSSGSLPTQTVNAPNLATTTTTLTSSLNPSTIGQQVTFTAVVTAQGFQGTPTGTVTIAIDGHAQTPVALSVVGGKDEAQFVTSTLTAGQHTVTAAYSGDTHVSGSTGSLPTQTVKAPNMAPTTTTLVSSLNPSAVGQQVTFTAIVSAGPSAGMPTGTVAFAIDGIPQPSVPLSLVNGHEQAVIAISTLSVAKHSISAVYAGNSTFASSTVATPLTQVVNDPTGEAPKVVKVLRYGVHWQPTILVIDFSTALNPISAQDPLNYVILGPAGGRIAIASAVYSPAANTVTLRPRTRINLHHNYRLTVIGAGSDGVTGADGIPLAGALDGQPGTNFVTTLNWRNLVLGRLPVTR